MAAEQTAQQQPFHRTAGRCQTLFQLRTGYRSVSAARPLAKQLTHLAEESRQPKVMIQVIPAEVSAHAGLGGAVSIADREGEPPVVHVDSFTAPQTTRAPEIVAKVRQRSDMLRGEALPRSASRELIMRVAEEEWKH